MTLCAETDACSRVCEFNSVFLLGFLLNFELRFAFTSETFWDNKMFISWMSLCGAPGGSLRRPQHIDADRQTLYFTGSAGQCQDVTQCFNVVPADIKHCCRICTTSVSLTATSGYCQRQQADRHLLSHSMEPSRSDANSCLHRQEIPHPWCEPD